MRTEKAMIIQSCNRLDLYWVQMCAAGLELSVLLRGKRLAVFQRRPQLRGCESFAARKQG